NNQQALFYYFQLLRDEGVAKLLSQPKIVTMSGRQAFFLSGGEQAVPQPGGLGAVSVQFRPFGTTINVLPVVLGNGKIYLEVEPEVSRLDQAAGTTVAGFTVAGRATQRVRTTVEMEAGQTFVIGGLIEHVVNGATQKMPVLGDLPFIGTLFSRKSFQEFETELVIMVTPYLVDPMSCDQVVKALPGQETRSPDDFELFLEGILEAPRGPRDVCVHRHYVPAYKHSPNAGSIPCAGTDVATPNFHNFLDGRCSGGACGDCVGGACRTEGCATSTESFGSGLANEQTMSYPGVAPEHAAEMPVGAESTRKAELMAPVDLSEPSEQPTGAMPMQMPVDSKPSALPSVFGPAGR
ncbi:MAG: type II and III secretion system protein family protein, partial [Gemmataceae bacterium]